MQKELVQVDAFTNRPLYGNPVAVVFDADDISAETDHAEDRARDEPVGNGFHP